MLDVIYAKKDKINFFLSTILKIVGAAFAIIFGTAHLAKFDQEQLLKAKLVGDTDIAGLRWGTYSTPSSDNIYCDVSGSYRVRNIGQYPFIVDSVTIELWKIPFITIDENNVVESISYSLSERLDSDLNGRAMKVGEPVSIKVNEQFGLNNELQRSFGFIVRIEESMRRNMDQGTGDRYVVIANAKARLDDRKPWYSHITNFIAGDPGIAFLPNDLRHISQTFNICG